MDNYKKAYLMLQDGTIYEGKSFGATGSSIGEVVFSTAMTGYQETLTDPSYFGQIVIQTFPLIGNYGINESDFESDKCHFKGYIVREYCDKPSNFRCSKTIDEFLKEQNIISIYDIDTRSLTKKIREHGVMNGIITTDEITSPETVIEKLNDFLIESAVSKVCVQETTVINCKFATFNVGLMDFGYKKNIARELFKRNCNVTILPCNISADEILSYNFDGLMLSNGPGDPCENIDIINTLKEVMVSKIPIFGICLGHQLLALANSAKTAKLKYGHRGANQPVTDITTGKTVITSQNHGYAVLGDSLDESIGFVSHVNANDKSCEGIKYLNIPAFTVQFHPEASCGPLDTSYLFDEFITLMINNK